MPITCLSRSYMLISHPHFPHSHQEHTSLRKRLRRSVHSPSPDKTYEQANDNTIRKRTRLLKILHHREEGETLFFLLQLWVGALVCLAEPGLRNTAVSKRGKKTPGEKRLLRVVFSTNRSGGLYGIRRMTDDRELPFPYTPSCTPLERAAWSTIWSRQ